MALCSGLQYGKAEDKALGTGQPLTTAVSANRPDIMSSGNAMARAQ